VQGPLVSERPTFHPLCRVKGRGERRGGILVVQLVAKGKIDISSVLPSFPFPSRVCVADGEAPPYAMLHLRLLPGRAALVLRAGV
jgi:hypothetical protein